MTSKIRIFRVTYKATRHPGFRRRLARVVVKVPYGGAFAMSELLTRMVAVGEIERFTIQAASPQDINDWRAALLRWLPALMYTSEWTGVDWTK